MKRILGVSLLFVVFGLFINDVGGTTKTNNFTVSANVKANCTITAGNIAFGDYSPADGDKEATGTINIKCSKNTAYEVGLSEGGSASFDIRKMSFGAELLEYNLYTDAGYLNIFKSAVDYEDPNTVGGTGTGMGNTLPHTVYAKLPDNANNQNAAVGTYSDTITATVLY